MEFPLPIVTPRLILRAPTKRTVDLNRYITAVSESIEELRPWMPWAQARLSMAVTKQYIHDCCENWRTLANPEVGLAFWIMNKTDNTFIGHIVIWDINWQTAEFTFGYWERTCCTNHGYITEAVNALTRYTFLVLGAKRVKICAELANKRSQAIPAHLNFQKQILPNAALAVANNQLTDVVLFTRENLANLPALEVNWPTMPIPKLNLHAKAEQVSYQSYCFDKL